MSSTSHRRIEWLAWGDLNAFFGLMLDNLLNLVVMSTLLAGVFRFPLEFTLTRMVPGTALGVLVGDLVYTWMAVRLARRTGRDDVTAMPLGLDTPSTIGVVLVVIGPVFSGARSDGMSEHDAAMVAWQVGMATMVAMGLVKVACSFVGDIVRRTVPNAGLLGSLGGIGIALLAFFPLLKIFHAPVAGMAAFGIVVYGLMAGRKLPLRLPAAFMAVVIGGVLYHVLGHFDMLGTAYEAPELPLAPALPLPTLEFVAGLGRAIDYLPVAIPFGILTIVGGINVTESARLAGDDYSTRDILLTEAVATLVAGLCGGVAQSTPYIGHPAYKRMGGRAGYTLFTGLFIGLGGALGLLQSVVRLIPEAAVMPILVFVGLEILGQSTQQCPQRHSAAVGLAFLPSIAEVIRIIVTTHHANLVGALGAQIDPGVFSPALDAALEGPAGDTLLMLSLLGRGFIITAVLWGAAAALVIDGRLRTAGIYLLICSALTVFGLIHSIAPSGGLYLAWELDSPLPMLVAAGYCLLGIALLPFGAEHDADAE
jgi:AGZA family xanthine/uracil permease-like MFS transporter